MAFYDPLTKILCGQKMPQIYDPAISVGQVLLSALHKTPDKISQVCDDDGIELSCSQIAKYMTNIAKNLSKLGFQSSDVAGFLVNNATYVPVTLFACYLVRMPVNPVDKSFSVNQIVQIYRETNPKIIFCDYDVVDKIMAVLGILESEATIVVLTEKARGLMHISDFFGDCDINDE